MAFFKVKVGEALYELEKLTLGEARRLKREFGMESLEHFSPTDPDQLVGLLVLACKRRHPEWTDETVLRFVEGLDIEHIKPEAPEEAEPVPTPAATAAPEPAGVPVTTPPTSGVPS